jgi:hypothetical protein
MHAAKRMQGQTGRWPSPSRPALPHSWATLSSRSPQRNGTRDAAAALRIRAMPAKGVTPGVLTQLGCTQAGHEHGQLASCQPGHPVSKLIWPVTCACAAGGRPALNTNMPATSGRNASGVCGTSHLGGGTSHLGGGSEQRAGGTSQVGTGREQRAGGRSHLGGGSTQASPLPTAAESGSATAARFAATLSTPSAAASAPVAPDGAEALPVTGRAVPVAHGSGTGRGASRLSATPSDRIFHRLNTMSGGRFSAAAPLSRG